MPKLKVKPPTCTLELIPLLRMIAPYKVEIYDTRHGPEIILLEGDRIVKTLRVTEDLAEQVAEALQMTEMLLGLMPKTNRSQ